MLKDFPGKITHFTPKTYLSTTAVARYDSEPEYGCLFKILYPSGKELNLQKNIYAVAGSLLHKWVEGASHYHNEKEGNQVIEDLLQLDRYAVNGEKIDTLLPPRQWIMMVEKFRKRVKKRLHRSTSAKSYQSSPHVKNDASRFGFLFVNGKHSEKRLEGNIEGIKIRGSVDEINIEGKHIEIVDFKSGTVVLPSGEVKPTLKKQLDIYALMTREHRTQTTITLSLLGNANPESWSFTQADEQKVRTMFSNLKQKVKKDPNPSTIANPGPNCSFCDLRPRCPSYIETAPLWWKKKPEWALQSDWRNIPMDIWGEVTRISPVLKIRSTVGHHTIRGLNTSQLSKPDNSTIQVGEKIALFNLLSIGNNHLNFTQKKGKKNYEKATSLTIFLWE